jgi:6-phosphogluconolactonase
VLDLVFLGIGEDGHVASLFPHDTEAFESCAVYRAITGPKPPPRRITLGYPALIEARAVWVLASGKGKSDILRSSLADDNSTPLARVLSSRTHTEIFTDFDLA